MIPKSTPLVLRAAIVSLFFGAVCVAGTARGDDAPRYRLRLDGAVPQGVVTPILVEAPALEVGNYDLVDEAGGSKSTVQVLIDGTIKRLATRVAGNGKTTRSFTLNKVGETTQTRAGRNVGPGLVDGVKVRETAQGDVEVTAGGRPFTTYHPGGGGSAKPYYFPLLTPRGIGVTRAYPMVKDVPGEDRDHPHQRSLWFTHGSVNGIDFWSELKGHGTIKETARIAVNEGPVIGCIHTTDDWLGPDGVRICSDERWLRVLPVDDVVLVDFEVALKSEPKAPTIFGDTKEGMFGLRVASSMDANRKPGGRIVNSEGLVDDAAWGKPAKWVDYSGPVGGKTVGVAVFDHPDNLRHPTTWHVRSYGLFAANPFGWSDFGMKKSGSYTLAPGQRTTFRYRLVIHDGGGDPARLERYYEGFAHAPRATIEPIGR